MADAGGASVRDPRGRARGAPARSRARRRRVLVTGASGMLGSDLGRRRSPPPGYEVLARPKSDLDIADAKAVARALARARARRPRQLRGVHEGRRLRDRSARLRGQRRRPSGTSPTPAAHVGAQLVQISTDFVFDGAKGAPYAEDDPVHPLSAYGRTQARAARRRRCGCPAASSCARRGSSGGRGWNFVEAILKQVEAGKARLSVVADQVGRPTATTDLVRGDRRAARRGRLGRLPLRQPRRGLVERVRARDPRRSPGAATSRSTPIDVGGARAPGAAARRTRSSTPGPQRPVVLRSGGHGGHGRRRAQHLLVQIVDLAVARLEARQKPPKRKRVRGRVLRPRLAEQVVERPRLVGRQRPLGHLHVRARGHVDAAEAVGARASQSRRACTVSIQSRVLLHGVEEARHPAVLAPAQLVRAGQPPNFSPSSPISRCARGRPWRSCADSAIVSSTVGPGHQVAKSLLAGEERQRGALVVCGPGAPLASRGHVGCPQVVVVHDRVGVAGTSHVRGESRLPDALREPGTARARAEKPLDAIRHPRPAASGGRPGAGRRGLARTARCPGSRPVRAPPAREAARWPPAPQPPSSPAAAPSSGGRDGRGMALQGVDRGLVGVLPEVAMTQPKLPTGWWLWNTRQSEIPGVTLVPVSHGGAPGRSRCGPAGSPAARSR